MDVHRWAPLALAVAEKAKEQASQLGEAAFSGAGNIAAATGLVKKEEFPADLKVRLPPGHCYAHGESWHVLRLDEGAPWLLPIPVGGTPRVPSCSAYGQSRPVSLPQACQLHVQPLWTCAFTGSCMAASGTGTSRITPAAAR